VLLPHERGLLTVPLPFGVYFDVLILVLGVVGVVLLYRKRIKGPVLVGIYGLIGLVAYPLLYRGGF
jgi:hypothetical protein